MKASLLFLPLLFLVACRQATPEPAGCRYAATGFDIDNNTATPIPIDSRNFWLYTDSVYNDTTGAWTRVQDFLLTPRNVYQVGTYASVSFNQFLPQLTIVGDSLFASSYNSSAASCYDLQPFLFPVSDTVALPGGSKLYPASAAVSTPAGTFSNNLEVRNGSYRMVVHPGLGIVRIEMGRRKMDLLRYELF